MIRRGAEVVLVYSGMRAVVVAEVVSISGFQLVPLHSGGMPGCQDDRRAFVIEYYNNNIVIRIGQVSEWERTIHLHT